VCRLLEAEVRRAPAVAEEEARDGSAAESAEIEEDHRVERDQS